jgi:hypothetical protein
MFAHDCRGARSGGALRSAAVQLRRNDGPLAAGATATEYVQADVSLDDHVQAVLASPAACRRVLRDLRKRWSRVS